MWVSSSWRGGVSGRTGYCAVGAVAVRRRSAPAGVSAVRFQPAGSPRAGDAGAPPSLARAVPPSWAAHMATRGRRAGEQSDRARRPATPPPPGVARPRLAACVRPGPLHLVELQHGQQGCSSFALATLPDRLSRVSSVARRRTCSVGVQRRALEALRSRPAPPSLLVGLQQPGFPEPTAGLGSGIYIANLAERSRWRRLILRSRVRDPTSLAQSRQRPRPGTGPAQPRHSPGTRQRLQSCGLTDSGLADTVGIVFLL